MFQMFLVVKTSGLQAGRFSTWTLQKPCCCNRCRVLFSIILLKYSRPCLKTKLCLNGAYFLRPAYTWALITSRTVSLAVSLENVVPMFPKKKFKFKFMWPQNSSARCLHFKQALVQRWLLHFWIVFIFTVASSLHNRALNFTSVDSTMSCGHRPWFLEVFLSKFTDYQMRILRTGRSWAWPLILTSSLVTLLMVI